MAKKRSKERKSLFRQWQRLFLNPGADPTKPMTRAYMLALGLIAILTISGHIITAHISEQQKDSTEIAYQIGRQRTLMQQILLYANNYYRLNEPLDYDFMMQSLWELEKGHEFLLKIIDQRKFAKGYTSPALYKIYHSPPFDLDEQMKTFTGLVREFSQYSPRNTSAENYDVKRKELMDKLSYKSTTMLRPALDSALEKYQTETLEEIARYYTFQLGGAIFVLLVLTAEALLIFKPLTIKIRQYHNVLQRYALEDSLTGLNNRRAFMNAAETELKRGRREKNTVIVALLDLDHFKKINDTYGHDIGDKVLQHFSGILKLSFRAGDITGRIGGEEFAILLPRIDRQEATTILQRLCNAVAHTPCEYEGPGGVKSMLNYTISIGFTGPVQVGDLNIDQLLSAADAGLYKAKERGRNCVVAVD